MTARVLIVDDDRAVRTILRLNLEPLYRVLEAPDGLAGWKLFQEEAPDLVVTDLGMPGLNGLDLIDRIRAHPERANTPLIILTGAVKGEDLPGEFWRIGTKAEVFLEKPISGERLRAEIDGLLKRTHGWRELPPGTGAYEA